MRFRPAAATILPLAAAFLTLLGLAGLAAAVPQTRGAAPPKPTSADRAGAALFETHARPVFVERCVSCHAGPKPAAGLRLDIPGGWKGVVGSGKLLAALRHRPGAPAMPPTGTPLSERQIDGIALWIRHGAPGPLAPVRTDPARHWAFQPLRPAPETSIDTLVAAGLRANGLDFAPPADRRTLIRRLAFDLTGLPPTPEEVDAFLSDKKPGAVERVVDRLLASPRYGEKWARHWLDLARFAESHGYEQDYDRPHAHTYRDFVIRAFNDDLPYDTFVRWQLAGDEIAPDNPQALFATGFLGAGTHATQITKSQVEKERYDELDDMLSVTGQAFLGLTIGCARCHDHKYDPIPTRDYYRMLATFTKTVRSDQNVPTDPDGDRARLAAWEAARVPLVAARTAWERDVLPGRFAAAPTASPLPVWTLPRIERMTSAGGATLTARGDGSVAVTGVNPEHETLTFTFKTGLRRLAAVRIEALADPSLMVGGGPGRATNGNFALSVLTVRVGEKPAPLTAARADFEQKGLPVAAAIDADPLTAWAVDPQFGKDHAAAFALAPPVDVPEGATVTVRMEFNNNTGHGMGRPRIALAGVADAPLRAEAAFDGPEGRLRWFMTHDPQWRALDAAVAQHDAVRPQPTIQRAMICSEGVPAIRTHTQGGDFLEQTHFLQRGDPNQKGAVAAPGFLSVLTHAAPSRWPAVPAVGGRTSGQRRALAAWIVDSDKGAGALAARVVVNRLWQRLTGRGIVATLSDFGHQGERPTHPELLDRLAADLIRDGWRLKPLIRRIVLSRTYRQSAATTPVKARRDPDNRWLSRASRRRLEAENLRDAMLRVGGQLDLTMYGPGTLDEAMRRRGIYFFVKRSRLVPFLSAFDAPNALQSVGVRQSTTVAPQALILMNNPQVRHWAEAFAARVAAPGDPAVAVRRAYRLALARDPAAAELSDALAFLNRGGALADFCQVLFSCNEFAYVD